MACSDVIKLSFLPIFSDEFRQKFHRMCQIDAKEGTARFVSLVNAVRELSQKSGRGLINNIYPPELRGLIPPTTAGPQLRKLIVNE